MSRPLSLIVRPVESSTYPRHGVWKALRCSGRLDGRLGTSLLMGFQPQLQPVGQAERGTRPRGETRQRITWPAHHYCPSPRFLYLFNFYKLLLSSKLFCRYHIVLCSFSSLDFNSLTTCKKSSGRSTATVKLNFFRLRRFPEQTFSHWPFTLN